MKGFMRKVKYIAVILVCVCLAMIFMPMTAYALPGDGGNQGLTGNTTSQYEIDNQTILVFVTGDGGYVYRSSGSNDDRTQQYTAVAYDGWVFSHWNTYYEGSAVKEANPQYSYGLGDDYYFSAPGDSESKFTKTSNRIQVNNEWDATGTYYLYAIFKPKVTAETDAGNTVSIRWTYTTLDSGFESSISKTECTVTYGSDLEINYYVGGRVVENVYVNGKSTSDYVIGDDGWLEMNIDSVTRPINLSLSSRKMKQYVKFDPNGGNGSMSVQTFYFGDTQTIALCAFSRSDYRFSSWNTKADGTGISYEGEESITLSPENDGDTITLYAQWEHTAHTGGEATCTNKAICDICGELYGEKNSTNHIGTVGWSTQSEIQHESTYSCCGAKVVVLENHEWNSGKCVECGYECSHSGGEATCTNEAVCNICNQPYGGTDSTNHTGTVGWSTQNATEHESTYSCCGAKVVVLENHEWNSGKCAECGYECGHSGGEANCTDKAVCDICAQPYGEKDGTNHAGETEIKDAVAAEEFKDGYSGDIYCLECGEKIADGEIVPAAHIHKYGNWIITKKATTQAKGSKEKTCGCGHKIVKSIPRMGENNVPQTGDSSNNVLWIQVAFLSLVMMGYLIAYEVKKKLNTKE